MTDRGLPFIILCASLLSQALGGAPAARVLPLELTAHLPPTDAKKAITLVKEADGSFAWTLADGLPQTLVFDLDALGFDPARFDEFRFDLLPETGLVDVQMKLKGYPAPAETSSWYLKTRCDRGAWNSCRFDLRTDDDGFWFHSDKPLPRQLEITLVKRAEGIPGEPNSRIARIARPRFVKTPLAVSFDLMGANLEENASEIACTYALTVENRSDQAVTARLTADSRHTLKYFKADAPASVALAAKQTLTVPIRLSIPRSVAMTLPPLYAEPLHPMADLEGVPDSDVTPWMGYRRWPMWGVVPIFNRFWWTPATMQAHLEARKAFAPGLETWKTKILQQADATLAVDWPLPPANLLPPGYGMGYTCPKCGSNNMSHSIPGVFTKHTCNACKATVEGNANLDRCGVWAYLAKRFEDVRALALAHLITGNEAYAQKAVAMFTAYADAYPSLPRSRPGSTAGGSRLNTTTLYSSYFLTPLADAYAYLHESKSLTPEARKKIEGFMLAEAGQIVRHCVYDSNMTAEHFRAYGTVGIDTGYWPLLGEAISGEFGWHEVVDHGFSEDGIAHEAGSYHRSIFYALMNFALFTSEQGVNLLTARTKRIFDGSLSIGVAGGDWWALAYQVYRDPAYLNLIEGAGLFHGLIGTPRADQVPIASTHMPGAGYLFLRKGTVADNREIRLNYINTFDRDEHDKFQTAFFRNGKPIDASVGRINYSHPRSHWMYDTAGHNAIVINGGNQQNVNGRLLAADLTGDVPMAVIETLPEAPLYPGVRQVRGIVLADECMIVFDRITSETPCTIDRYQYGPGSPALSSPTNRVNSLPDLPADGAFTNLVGGPAGRMVDVNFGGKLDMRVVSDADMSAYQARTVGSWLGTPLDATFIRVAEKREATFLAAFSDEKGRTLPDLDIVESSDKRLVFNVKTTERVYRIEVDQTARRVAVTGTPSVKAAAP